ncbi:hypothetical protein HHL24_17730 [Paraburkholderia sp. RP-4-7]|uniref:Uncharacterized protein n=1 Tax=Paraburkholderia polaris TaxID=2728848 RepID=A0A848IBB6_9BURK|nr:hypothetical protein [Paraburkholderia polaris]NML99767.1 hypothetical protein [Paraburkholderia polaris]
MPIIPGLITPIRDTKPAAHRAMALLYPSRPRIPEAAALPDLFTQRERKVTLLRPKVQEME